jgi:hypothetical protein
MKFKKGDMGIDVIVKIVIALIFLAVAVGLFMVLKGKGGALLDSTHGLFGLG